MWRKLFVGVIGGTVCCAMAWGVAESAIRYASHGARGAGNMAPIMAFVFLAIVGAVLADK